MLSSGTEGSGFLLHHTAETGAVVHANFTVPTTLRSQIDEALGPGPTGSLPIDVRTRWIVDVYLGVGLDSIRPDLAILWLGTVDTIAHGFGVGTPGTLEAIRRVDAELGRLEAGLRERGIRETTNLLVVSDHGFSTHGAGFEPDRILARVGAQRQEATLPIVRAGGAIYVPGDDADTVGRIVRAMQHDPGVGPIFTRATQPGSAQGSVAGMLSLELVHWNHPRAGDILASANWSDAVNDHGYAGRSTSPGIAGHGSTSPFDIHATLVATGPDVRQGGEIGVPSSNVDLAATLLYLFDLEPPPTMDGRILHEAFRDGPSPDSVAVTRTEHSASVSLDQLEYSVTAYTATVDGRRYLDRVSVQIRRHER